MKICLDIRVSTQGGTSTFIDNFVRHLSDVEHQHSIQFVFNEGTTALNGKHVRAAAVPHKNRLLEFKWSQWSLPHVLKRLEFDVYHSLKHVGPIFCPTSTIYRVPAVGQFLGNYPMQTLDHFYWAYFAKKVYHRADLLVAVSQYIRRGLIEHLKVAEDRVITIYNGVDERFRPLEKDQLPTSRWRQLGITRPYILCVGNLVPVKNFATAIRAYDQLHKTHGIEPQLVLAGATRHPHYRDLCQLVEELKLGDHVRFVGYQSSDQLLYLYNGAEMLVHPSLHEGFSFTILEAMACGLPIIASATTSIPEAAGAAALYHDEPENPEQLADCIHSVLDSHDLSRQLSQLALDRAAEFSWAKCVSKTVALYDRFAVKSFLPIQETQSALARRELLTAC